MNCLHRLVWFGKNTESVFVMNSYLTIMDISDDKAVDFQLAYFIFSAISLCKKKGARLPIFTFFAVYKAPALIALFSRCYCQLFGSLDVCLSPQLPRHSTCFDWHCLALFDSDFIAFRMALWLVSLSLDLFCIFVITLVHLSKIHQCHMASVLSLCLLPILL